LILTSSTARMILFKTIKIWVLSMRMRYKLLYHNYYLFFLCYLFSLVIIFVLLLLMCIYYFMIACKSSYGIEATHTSKSYQRCGEIFTPQNWAYS
jgi:hypothetical protein